MHLYWLKLNNRHKKKKTIKSVYTFKDLKKNYWYKGMSIFLFYSIQRRGAIKILFL